MVDLFGTIHRKKIIFHKNDLNQSKYFNITTQVLKIQIIESWVYISKDSGAGGGWKVKDKS